VTHKFRVRLPAALATLALLLAVAAPGCGDDDGSGNGGADPASLLPEPKPGDRPPPPPQALAENLPPPDTRGLSRDQKVALRAGRRACRGKTPLQVRDEYLAEATDSGSLDLDSPQGELVSDLSYFRFEPDEGPSFAAGQLAAGVYEATLPESTANAGFQGCVYELARVQVRRMRQAAAG
jgi:hypothetical protein